MNSSIECEKEADGRWIAEIPQLLGILSYVKFKRAQERNHHDYACAWNIHVEPVGNA